MSPTFHPFLEELSDRILPSASLHLPPPETTDAPSNCIEMRSAASHTISMNVLTSSEECCHEELEVHVEHGELVVHLPPSLEGRIVGIEDRNSVVTVGHDGHAHLPFTEPAGTLTLTITNQEGEPLPFLRITHDGHGTITQKACLIDLHTLMDEKHDVHIPHESHTETHIPHTVHPEHPPHALHLPHTGHGEKKHETHSPHPSPQDIEHQEPFPLEEHEPMEDDTAHENRRSTDQRERDDRALLEEAVDWGAWWDDTVESPRTVEGPVPTHGKHPSKEEQRDSPTKEKQELWPIIGSATVAAASLAGAAALERRARRKRVK